MTRIKRNARLIAQARGVDPEPDDATLNEMAKAILAKVPLGYGMTPREAREYARAAWRVGIAPYNRKQDRAR